jgi:hypothetical protein
MNQASKCPIVSIIKTVNAMYKKPRSLEEIDYIDFVKDLVDLNVVSLTELNKLTRQKLLSLYNRTIDKFHREEALSEVLAELHEKFILFIDKKISGDDFSLLLHDAFFNYFSSTMQADLTAQVDKKLAAINDQCRPSTRESYYYV